MKLNLSIHENYLLLHLLNGRNPVERFAQDLDNLKNKAWEVSKSHYNTLLARMSNPHDLNDDVYVSMSDYLRQVKQTNEFQLMLNQTQEYLNACKRDWDEQFSFCFETITNITGFNLEGQEFTAFITHPCLGNGKHVGKNTLVFGHNDDWPHYSIVYFWHEILHDFFGKSDIEHALIELTTDEELRIRLNGGEYPPFVGHSFLNDLKMQILPHWKDYIRSDQQKDIMKFKKHLVESIGLPEYVQTGNQ